MRWQNPVSAPPPLGNETMQWATMYVYQISILSVIGRRVFPMWVWRCVLPSREASSLVAEIGLSSSLLSVWCVGDKELSLFGPNNSLDIAINDHEPFFTCELDE